MTGQTREETANYLLNHCFLMGEIDSMRERYYEILENEDAYREIFKPFGYTIVIHRNLKVIQLVNEFGYGKLELKKYESIFLLILRLLYLEKRENTLTSGGSVIVTVEELETEYEKLVLPRKFDKTFLEQSLGNVKKYNLAMPLDKLTTSSARIQIYPSIMLALPDSAIQTAYEATKGFLKLYEEEGLAK